MDNKEDTKIFQEETKTVRQVFEKSFFTKPKKKSYGNLFESVKQQSIKK